MAARSIYNLARRAAQRRARRVVPETSSSNYLEIEENFLAQQAIARQARKSYEAAARRAAARPVKDSLAGASRHERAMATRKGLRSKSIKELESDLRFFDSMAFKMSRSVARKARHMAHSTRAAINYKRRRAGTQKGMKKPR